MKKSQSSKARDKSSKGSIKDVDRMNEELEALKAENTRLSQELKLAKFQIAKIQIKDFLEGIFDTKLDHDILTDVLINEKNNSIAFNAVGRAKVIGSSKSQMRHVIPYKFIEKLIENKINNSGSGITTWITNIDRSLKVLINSQDGLCLSKSNNSNIIGDLNDDLFSKKLVTDRDTYYFISKSFTDYEQVTESCRNTGIIEQAKQLYIDKGKKFISSALNLLNVHINDQNTLSIAVEQLTRIIFTLFNQKTNAAFPEEGNTLNNEIRLYNSIADAEDPKNKSYTLLTQEQVVKELEKLKDFNKKIRIINNEGNVVINSFKALDWLNKLMDQSLTKEQKEQYLTSYNKKHAKDQFSFNLPVIEYTAQLTFKNYITNSSYHIAKYLYAMFDFKPLEVKVVVPGSGSNGEPQIEFYTSANSHSLGNFCIKDGNNYRKEQIEKIPSRKYNKEVVFRPGIVTPKDKEHNILVKLAVEYICIAKETFTNFNKKEVSKTFYAIIEFHYNDYKDIVNELFAEKKSFVDRKTDSEVNYETSTVGEVSLMDLLGISG